MHFVFLGTGCKHDVVCLEADQRRSHTRHTAIRLLLLSELSRSQRSRDVDTFA